MPIYNFDEYAERARRKLNREDFLDDDEPLDEQNDDAEGEAISINPRQILKMAAVLAAVALLVLVIVLQSGIRQYTGASYSKIADLSGQEDTEYMELGNHVVSYSHDGASCMDNRGNQIWNITFEMQQPIAVRSGDVIAIADYNGSTIYILSATESLGSVSTSMPIRGLAVAENGEVAAVLSNSDVTWIYLYDVKGNELANFKTTMSQSGYPLAVAISPNGKLVCVSHLTIGTQTVNTSVAFYNFGDVGQNTTDNNVSGFNFDDEVFPFVTFFDNDSAAALSDGRLVFFEGSEIPQSKSTAMFSDRIEAVYSSTKYVGVLFPDTTGEEKYAMKVYNADGAQIGSIQFSMDYTQIQICGDRVIVNNDQELLVCNVDGTIRYQGEFDQVVKAVIPSSTSSSRLTIVTETDVEQMILE